MSRIKLYDEKHPTTVVLDIEASSVEEGVIEMIASEIGIEYFDVVSEEALFGVSELDNIYLDTELNLESFIGEVETIKELCNKYNASCFRFIN